MCHFLCNYTLNLSSVGTNESGTRFFFFFSFLLQNILKIKVVQWNTMNSLTQFQKLPTRQYCMTSIVILQNMSRCLVHWLSRNGSGRIVKQPKSSVTRVFTFSFFNLKGRDGEYERRGKEISCIHWFTLKWLQWPGLSQGEAGSPVSSMSPTWVQCLEYWAIFHLSKNHSAGLQNTSFFMMFVLWIQVCLSA